METGRDLEHRVAICVGRKCVESKFHMSFIREKLILHEAFAVDNNNTVDINNYYLLPFTYWHWPVTLLTHFMERSREAQRD